MSGTVAPGLEAGGGDELVVKTEPPPVWTLSHGPRSSEMWQESILEMGGCGGGSACRSPQLRVWCWAAAVWWWWWWCRTRDAALDRSPRRPAGLGLSSTTLAHRLLAEEGLLAAAAAGVESSGCGCEGPLEGAGGGGGGGPRARGLLLPRGFRPSCGVFQVDCMEFSIMRLSRLSSPCRSCTSRNRKEVS